MAAALDAFVKAQDPVLEAVEGELQAGRKQSHWMWYVFPQLAGLGSSPMAQRYALDGLQAARAYLAHPVLGERLRRHVRLMLGHAGTPAQRILGSPDDLKFRSCLTLFLAASQERADHALFAEALEAFYAGEGDPLTLRSLGAASSSTMQRFGQDER